MRIVGGMWRGRQLEAPEGRAVTRPTTDRTREAMASMVLSAFDLDLSEVAVLDAFAGSGAIGFELLSRGAARCTFVESDRAALARVKRNARLLGAEPKRCAFLGADVFKLAARGSLAQAPFSLVVLDPPYAMEAERIASLLLDLKAHEALAPGAIILYERTATAPALPAQVGTLIKSRVHGGTAVDLVRMGDAHE